MRERWSSAYCTHFHLTYSQVAPHYEVKIADEVKHPALPAPGLPLVTPAGCRPCVQGVKVFIQLYVCCIFPLSRLFRPRRDPHSLTHRRKNSRSASRAGLERLQRLEIWKTDRNQATVAKHCEAKIYRKQAPSG